MEREVGGRGEFAGVDASEDEDEYHEVEGERELLK